MTPRGQPLSVALRDALAAAVVALLVFQGLRTFVAERYRVPSGSMQPTLFGDLHSGDMVLVNKLSGSGGLKPYDLVVMRNPEDSERFMVKRVAALGSDPERCCVEFEDGDLWVGPDEQHLARDRKDPLAMRDLRVPWFEHPGADAAEVARFLAPAAAFAVPAPELKGSLAADPELIADLLPEARRARLGGDAPSWLPAGYLGTARPVDASFLDVCGVRHRFEDVTINDSGADFELEGGDALSGLVVAMDLRPDTYAWIVRDRVQFFRNGEPVGPSLERPPTLGRVEFGFLDNSFFLAIDDRLVDWRERPAAWVTPAPPVSRPTPRSLLYWRGLGEGVAHVRRVRVFRDIWYSRDRVPFGTAADSRIVPPGSVYLLGDNGFDSSDSRQHGPYPLGDFIGRPVMVLGPWPRWRWLHR